MLFLFLLFLVFAYAGRCSSMERDRLLDCFSRHVDLNHDGNITLSEIPSFTKPWFFNVCDINNDGVLNLYDWNHPEGCCKTRECIYKVCNLCFNKLHWQ